ncbi:MAG: AraC family transcriptional regulator [Caldilineaceae bacterium]|nr:AraC family transcriptional regulator [Caldilineaceae bacterium]MCB9138202.1 AraC family transcriptional regulator [Caldilineaceae bacterium]
MSQQASDRLAYEGRRVETRKNELADLIAHFMPQDGAIRPIDDLYLFRMSAPGKPIHSVYKPSLCVVAQGSKEFFLRDERYVYDPDNYLLVTAKLPLVGQVLAASHEEPYLSLLLELDPTLVGAVIAEAEDIAPQHDANVRAVDVSSLQADLLDAVLRLVRLLDKPSEAPLFAQTITKEIIYRLWLGSQRDRLLHIVNSDGNAPLIAQAIDLITKEYDQPIRVETIARDLGMSVSGFHHHFKAVTAMSPLQYQKRLRLQESRRLMLGGGLTATDVASRVGYNNSSHFSRDYKRLFGAPPKSDIARLQADAGLGLQ